MAAGLKDVLGRVPMMADLYDAVRRGRPRTRYNLEQLAAHLPSAIEQTRPFAERPASGRKVLLFATLHYWIEQAVMVGLALRGQGHDVTIAYLPFASLETDISRFDLRRQDLYTRRVLQPLNGLVRVISLLDVKLADRVPDELAQVVDTSAAFDTMYRLQVEEFDPAEPLFQLRQERNRYGLLRALRLINEEMPDTVLVPNGLVTELGVFYQVARYLDLQTVTYEFNDQREQVWLAQNDIIMHQNTDSLWAARGARPLEEQQRQAIAAFEDARSHARKYGKGTRFWQDVVPMGGEQLRQVLHLDRRPVALLATNVLGDSLTLGRHLFAASMAQWIEKTVQHFAS